DGLVERNLVEVTAGRQSGQGNVLLATLALQILAEVHRPYLQNPSAKLLARRHLIIGIGWPRPGREPADDVRLLSQPLDDEIGQAGVLLLAPLPSQPRSHPQRFGPLDVL